MGGGISMALVNAGISVLLKDTDAAALARGIAAIRKNYLASVQKGRFTPKFVEERMAMIHPQTGYEGFESVDIIIEAVFESMALKKQIFAEIDKVAKPDCILATNTSTLDVDEIARHVASENGVGTHFFSPRISCVWSKSCVATQLRHHRRFRARACEKLGKVGVVVELLGIVGNRMMFRTCERRSSWWKRASPSQVDKVLFDFGMAMESSPSMTWWHRYRLACPAERKHLKARRPCSARCGSFVRPRPAWTEDRQRLVSLWR
jgi:3-hydroxyacyl-CoA dehydrogenase